MSKKSPVKNKNGELDNKKNPSSGKKDSPIPKEGPRQALGDEGITILGNDGSTSSLKRNLPATKDWVFEYFEKQKEDIDQKIRGVNEDAEEIAERVRASEDRLEEVLKELFGEEEDDESKGKLQDIEDRVYEAEDSLEASKKDLLAYTSGIFTLGAFISVNISIFKQIEYLTAAFWFMILFAVILVTLESTFLLLINGYDWGDNGTKLWGIPGFCGLVLVIVLFIALFFPNKFNANRINQLSDSQIEDIRRDVKDEIFEKQKEFVKEEIDKSVEDKIEEYKNSQITSEEVSEIKKDEDEPKQ